MRTHAKPSALSLLERTLAAYVSCVLNGDADAEYRLATQLLELGTPRWLLDNVRRTRGRWTVSDDDRIDAIVDYAARLTDAPDRVGERDAARLRAVGVADFDIADVRNVVAYYNA